MNRPQYFYTTPKGFQDIPYVCPVTFGGNATGGVAAGQYLNNFVVQLDNDADQLFRSLFFQGIQQGQGVSYQIQMRDAYGNYLTDGYIPIYLLVWGAGSTPEDGGSGRAMVFEPELYCPKGSCLLIDYYFPSGGSYPGLYEFRGVKRFPLGCPS